MTCFLLVEDFFGVTGGAGGGKKEEAISTRSGDRPCSNAADSGLLPCNLSLLNNGILQKLRKHSLRSTMQMRRNSSWCVLRSHSNELSSSTYLAALYAAKRSEMQESSQDRWSKTYISSSKGGQSSKSEAQTSTSTSTTEFRRFPKPRPFSSVILRHDVTDHINSTTRAQTQPALPKQHSFHVDSDVLPSMGPHEPMLSKVYGSVLQPADSLPLHSCAICLAIFPPDATIYPNPSQQSPDTPSYVCRTCFSTNGGSKGICPTCSKPVLALKAEGAFIHSGGKYWHKRCFNCFSCLRNIGESPLVDLAGRPSCEGCFDNSYKEPTTPKKQWPVASDESPTNQSDTPADSKRTIEELEQRLNIRKSQAGSPSRPTPTKIPVSPPLAADRFSSPQSKRLSSPPRLAPVSIEFKRSVSRETAAEPVQKTPFGYPTM